VTIATIPDLLGTSPADLLALDPSAPIATQAEARTRSERIRTGLETYTQTRQDIADAYARRDWVALDYPSYFAYLEAEFGDALKRLTRDERPQAIADLRGQGLSTRQIAEKTGVPQSTVSDTVRKLTGSGQLEQPEKITGTDGKDRPATRTTPKTPGPADTTTQPTDPGATPAPAVDHSTTAPAVPPQEPDLAADVVRALGDVSGVAGELGLTVAEIWCKMPAGVRSDAVKAAVEELAEAGRVEPAGRVLRGNRMEPRWQLAESATGECIGADMDCGRPLPCPDHPRTPEERIAAVAEVAPEFVKPVEPAAADPRDLVAAALDKHVPDPDAPKRAWRKELYRRHTGVSDFVLWLNNTEDAARFADEQDVETLRLLAVTFADLHRRVVEARTATVTPLRRIK
jgi:hypothetical protein